MRVSSLTSNGCNTGKDYCDGDVACDDADDDDDAEGGADDEDWSSDGVEELCGG